MDYIAQQLHEFRSGARRSGFMQPIAAALTESEIESVAHYYATRPRTSNDDTHGDTRDEKGWDIASLGGTRNGPACLTCHAQDADARNPDVPRLGGQSARYIGQQLLLFRSGRRAQTPNARVMTRIAQQLSDEDIANVARYLATLPSQ
jgi:cytochrome c553